MKYYEIKTISTEDLKNRLKDVLIYRIKTASGPALIYKEAQPIKSRY